MRLGDEMGATVTTRQRLRPGALVLAVVLALGLAVAGSPTAAATTTARPGAPAGNWRTSPPDELGPYEVGHRTITVVDPARDGRTLPVDVWYPVDPGDGAGRSAAEYDLLLAQLPSDVAVARARVSGDGPFPLIVFSHGSGGIRFQSYFLTEALASHGFVVAAPDHVGNTAVDQLLGTPTDFAESAVNRPQDVSVVIDQMLYRSTRPTPFEGRIDRTRIGVTGHSFGGFTTLASATESLAGAADGRVDAIAPIAPAAGPLTDEQLAGIDVPTLVVGGTLDDTTPIEPNSVRPYALADTRWRYRVDITGAGHASFTNTCDFYDTLAPVAPADILEFLEGNRNDACGPDLVDVGEAQRLTNYYVVAFMRRFLGGRPGYGVYLRPSDRPIQSEPDVLLFSRGADEGRRCDSVSRGPRCQP